VLSPDGRSIAFSSMRNPVGIYRKSSSGAGSDELLVATKARSAPTDWSPDGRLIAFVQLPGDIWILPLAGDRKPFAYVATPAVEVGARFSPDGHWVAYWSDETGRDEVFVQDFPSAGAKFQVSTNGGSNPQWRRDGRELFYLAADGQMMSVAVTATPDFSLGVPASLFQTSLRSVLQGSQRRYGVSADGQRFLMNTSLNARSLPPITVIVNWQKALEGR
jgi:Tol biopolymer transport system component